MSLPYRILFSVLLLAALGFGLGPWLTMKQIANAATGNDSQSWPALVRTEAMQDYAGQILTALLDLKMQADLKKNPGDAMRDNLQGRTEVKANAESLTQPQGLRHLLCGELRIDVAPSPAEADSCWALRGTIRWESPMQARAVFSHPQTHWQSSLILRRTGLFSWRAVDIELPVDAIIDRYAASLGLKEKSSI